jgi:hypothetical protein
MPLAVDELSIVDVSHLLLYWGSWMGFMGLVWWIYFHFPIRSLFQPFVYILLIFTAFRIEMKNTAPIIMVLYKPELWTNFSETPQYQI